jgi:hypothetical protein
MVLDRFFQENFNMFALTLDAFELRQSYDIFFQENERNIMATADDRRSQLVQSDKTSNFAFCFRFSPNETNTFYLFHIGI